MSKSACAALLALNISWTSPALAAGCATSADVSALKTAVMQQELMVAAFQCHEADAYNHFVTSYRSELQSSDAALKAFFVRRGGEHGEAGYDTFKTKAANLSALEQARHGNAFCADAHSLFTAALSNPGSLANFVESRSGTIDIGGICVESRPVLAGADAKPERSHATPQTNVNIAQTGSAEIAVRGVPAHSMPAMPYRPRNAQNSARDRDGDDEEVSYANDETPRAYGPPPGWQPQDWRPYPPPPR